MTYQEILKDALDNHYAIAQLNSNNLEFTRWILETCEELKTPVIIGFSEGAIKYIGGYNTVVKMVNGLKKDLNITIPAFIHLDHGASLLSCQKAKEAGFDSVMFDGSALDIDENIKISKKVKETCPDVIETEIGAISLNSYASEEDVKKMVDNVDPDMVAIAVGNAHGLYKSKPDIQFDLIEKISYSTHKPLVLHGGTGLDDDTLKKCIERGVVKINFNTELQVAWNSSLREFLNANSEVYDPRKIILSGKEAVREVIKHKIIVLGSNNKVK